MSERDTVNEAINSLQCDSAIPIMKRIHHSQLNQQPCRRLQVYDDNDQFSFLGREIVRGIMN